MFKWDICEKSMRYVPNLKESFIFYMSTINLESDRTLDFLKKHMQICLLKNGLENSISKQSQRIKNILTFTNFTL
jgi:hypothetical protein